MIVGITRETRRHEHRVALTPYAAAQLTAHGHTVVVERSAGLAAHFGDGDYQRAGATIVYGRDEPYQRADLVCRVGAIPSDEVELMRPGGTVCAFHHLVVAPRGDLERLLALGATLIGYEVIRERGGGLPVLFPISEIAGQMALDIASNLLHAERGGRGILLGNVPGVPPPTVLILGAGAVGRAAARESLARGAHVIVVDADLRALREINTELAGRVVTSVAGLDRLERLTAIADVLIGAVLVPGARAPFLVTEAMVARMKSGSVIIDLSIDQGGCVETSRPTTLGDPTFVVHEVVHYCVPNMTASVPRTASRALAHALLPYVLDLAGKGVEAALRDDAGLASGVYLFEGKVVNPRLAETLGVPPLPLEQRVGERAPAETTQNSW